jgi:DNA-binding CsgD family transcriptional regulator
MTRLLYLPDDATVIQLEVSLTPAELTAAVNAGLRPIPLLRASPAARLTASQVNNTVIVAPLRGRGRPPKTPAAADLTRRQRQVTELSAKGFTSQEIAEMLGISRRAVNYHLSQVRARVRGQAAQAFFTDPAGDDN